MLHLRDDRQAEGRGVFPSRHRSSHHELLRRGFAGSFHARHDVAGHFAISCKRLGHSIYLRNGRNQDRAGRAVRGWRRPSRFDGAGARHRDHWCADRLVRRLASAGEISRAMENRLAGANAFGRGSDLGNFDARVRSAWNYGDLLVGNDGDDSGGDKLPFAPIYGHLDRGRRNTLSEPSRERRRHFWKRAS